MIMPVKKCIFKKHWLGYSVRDRQNHFNSHLNWCETTVSCSIIDFKRCYLSKRLPVKCAVFNLCVIWCSGILRSYFRGNMSILNHYLSKRSKSVVYFVLCHVTLSGTSTPRCQYLVWQFCNLVFLQEDAVTLLGWTVQIMWQVLWREKCHSSNANSTRTSTLLLQKFSAI